MLTKTRFIPVNLNKKYKGKWISYKISQMFNLKSRVRHFSCRDLQSYDSSGDWARELFKPFADSASLVVEIEKNNFRFQWGVFLRWRHKEDMFWKSKPRLAGPGPQPIDPFFWLKILLKTRWKSASIKPFTDLLANLWPKLWVKNPVFGLIPNFSEKA